MLLFKRSSLVAYLLLCIYGAFAQQFPSKNFSTLDGLPSNDTKAIYKDSRGILWVGTQNGIATIINGKIKTLTAKDGFPKSSCWTIEEDSHANIWFGCYGNGVFRFDGKNIKSYHQSNGLIHDEVRTLFAFKKAIYVGTTHGISVIDTNTNRIQNFVGKGLEKRFQVMGFFEYRDEVYCMTYIDGIWKIENGYLKLVRPNHDPYGSISVYKNNNTIYADDKDPFKGEALQKTSVPNFLSEENKNQNHFGNTHFWNYSTDKHGTIYAAGYGVDYPTGGVFQITDNAAINLNEKYGIESHDVWSLYYDRPNDFLYVGTLDKGLYQIDLSGSIVFHNNGMEQSLIGIDQLKGSTFFLYENDLRIESEGKATVIPKRRFHEFATHYANANHLSAQNKAIYPSNALHEFGLKSMQVHEGLLWIGTSRGMYVLDANGTFKQFLPIRNNNTFGFNTSGELLSPLPYSGIEVFPNPTSLRGMFTDVAEQTPVDIVKVLNVSKKCYLVSRSKGLFSYRDGTFKSYCAKRFWNEKALVQATKNDKDELILANSLGDVFLINDHEGFKVVAKIPSAIIFGNTITVLESYKDLILIGTDKGLNIWKNGVLRFLDEEQGLTNKIFTSSKIIGHDLLLGTDKGCYVVDLQRYLNSNPFPFSIAISDITVNNEPYNKAFEWFRFNDKKIKLPYDKNTLSFSFTPINHPFPNKLFYRYKIIGLDRSEWSAWSQNQNINLPFLPEGNFKLRLEVKDFATGRTKSFDLIQFIITPPFWKTWGFYFGISVLICSSAYWAYRKRIAHVTTQEREKAEIQKRLSETRLEALQSQMNPHFIFNAMNSIQHFIIDNDTDKALSYMGEFAKLVRQTLDNSSKLRISLDGELDYLKSYIALENMRVSNRVDVKISVAESIDPFEVEVPPMLIQPFVENVFVHAFDGSTISPQLTLIFAEQESALTITIQDNGKGMSATHNNNFLKSKGMRLAKERIALIQDNSRIEIISNTNDGTTIILKLRI